MIAISMNDQPVTTELQDLKGFIQTHYQAEGSNLAASPSAPFAVALNGEFVPKSAYATTQLKDGDKLDIVSPIGGG